MLTTFSHENLMGRRVKIPLSRSDSEGWVRAIYFQSSERRLWVVVETEEGNLLEVPMIDCKVQATGKIGE
jgi:hypothetical protein